MARRLFPFNRFIGLDTVTSPTNMSERFFVELDGAYVDFRGQIVRGPGVDNTGQGSGEYTILLIMALSILLNTNMMAQMWIFAHPAPFLMERLLLLQR